MRKSKLYLSVICICLGILLIVGSAALIIKSRYAEDKSISYCARILSRLHSSMPESDRSSGSFDIFSAASLSIDGVDYIGILSMPSVDVELPVVSGYSESDIAVYRVSEMNSPPALSCNSKNWSDVADASVGDKVTLTDMRGCAYEYTVAEIARVNSYELTASTSDDMSLTLVTVSKGAYVILKCEMS